jgi:PAS domain S-box-containing protein
MGIQKVSVNDLNNDQLRDRVQLLRFALHRSRDYILYIHPSGRLFYVNESAAMALGYSRQDMMGVAE